MQEARVTFSHYLLLNPVKYVHMTTVTHVNPPGCVLTKIMSYLSDG